MTTYVKRAILGAALGFMLAATATPADARSITGFGSFKVKGTYSVNPYTCLSENNGAVVNNCGFAVSLYFNLPIDNTGAHTITVQSYWGSTASFSCYPYEVAGVGAGATGIPGAFYSDANYELSGAQYWATNTIVTGVGAPNGGESIYMICWNVPPGAGVANINWYQ